MQIYVDHSKYSLGTVSPAPANAVTSSAGLETIQARHQLLLVAPDGGPLPHRQRAVPARERWWPKSVQRFVNSKIPMNGQ